MLKRTDLYAKKCFLSRCLLPLKIHAYFFLLIRFPGNKWKIIFGILNELNEERSGSVVECLIWDQGVAGSSLTEGTA